MTKPDRPERSLSLVVLFLVVAAILAGLQAWNAYSLSTVVEKAESSAAKTLQKDQLDHEKTRQELIGKHIENQSKREFWISLTSGLSGAVATLGAILAAILALRGYADAREKERRDRAETERKESVAREKERQERLGASLGETFARLVSDEWRQRVVGAAGLLPFFAADHADFHPQALAVLVAAARIEEDEPAVRQGIRLAVEKAVRTVAPAVLAGVSWQGVRLHEVNLVQARLAGLDLRDAVLENARLSKVDLTGTDLTAARLQGAQLDGATLTDAVLTYADLAGATLAGATLARANWSHAKVLNLDLEGADLRDIGTGFRGVPWDATRNWRKAKFDQPCEKSLSEFMAPSCRTQRVLMLVWEIPPLVAGGTWTACYHLVRNLRRRGADVTVVVPWARHAIVLDPPPFGVDVPVVTLDVELPAAAVATSAWSPYGWLSAPASYSHQSAYAGWSSYGSAYVTSAYGGIYGPYGAGSLSGSILFNLIRAFAQRLRDYVSDHPTDLIHAHDWVTFDAARAAAEHINVPWIAHFHSTEADRQPGNADPFTERIEQSGFDKATRVVAVSKATERRLFDAYDSNRNRAIDVVPNSFSASDIPASEMGRFETHRVVFLGRLTRQKGVDRFCEIADHVRSAKFDADFVAYGDGPDRQQLYRHGISSPGALNWDKRGTAFRGASALVVPSRNEPFGMVVLEALLHRVPVIYPAESGAAEVLKSGIKLASGDTVGMADAVMRLLGDLGAWEEAILAGAREIERYPANNYEDRLIGVWSEAIASVKRK